MFISLKYPTANMHSFQEKKRQDNKSCYFLKPNRDGANEGFFRNFGQVAFLCSGGSSGPSCPSCPS
jgi:hypothetical protein